MDERLLHDHYDPEIELIEDYRECFDFCCAAHEVHVPRDRRKVLFLTRIGQATYAKLKTLVILQPLTELSLDVIVKTLATHHRPDTIEIAERYKFFEQQQGEAEGVAEYVAELRRLAKTWNFGMYLNTTLWDQVVCGL